MLYRKLYEVLFQGNFANNNTYSCGDLCQFTEKTSWAKFNYNFWLIFLITAKVNVMIQW